MPTERLAAHYAGLTLSTSNTLGTALAGLGHDCQGTCPESLTTTSAAVWFARLRPGRSLWTRTLVEVDLATSGWSPREVRRLGADVNECVHGDRIRVREMRTTGRGASSSPATLGFE